MTIHPVRQTVVLAAGTGSRINGDGDGMPKPLIEVAGRPLLGHALEQARAAGCTEAVVVLGSEAERVAGYLDSVSHGMSVIVVHNPHYELPNGNSLLVAEPWVTDRFYLQMVDHVFRGPALRPLARTGAAQPEGVFLLVDPAPGFFDEEDATTVRLDPHGAILAIGKGVRPWDAVDAGIFLLDARAFDALRRVEDAAERSLSAGMRVLAGRRELHAVKLHDVPWVDVDTTRELRRARTLLEGRLPEAEGLTAQGENIAGLAGPTR